MKRIGFKCKGEGSLTLFEIVVSSNRLSLLYCTACELVARWKSPRRVLHEVIREFRDYKIEISSQTRHDNSLLTWLQLIKKRHLVQNNNGNNN